MTHHTTLCSFLITKVVVDEVIELVNEEDGPYVGHRSSGRWGMSCPGFELDWEATGPNQSSWNNSLLLPGLSNSSVAVLYKLVAYSIVGKAAMTTKALKILYVQLEMFNYK